MKFPGFSRILSFDRLHIAKMELELTSFRKNLCSLSIQIKKLIEESLTSAATINQLNAKLHIHKITQPSTPVEKSPPPSNCYYPNQNSSSNSSHANDFALVPRLPHISSLCTCKISPQDNNLDLVPSSTHYSPQPKFTEVTQNLNAVNANQVTQRPCKFNVDLLCRLL